jgi:hypothetical protein
MNWLRSHQGWLRCADYLTVLGFIGIALSAVTIIGYLADSYTVQIATPSPLALAVWFVAMLGGLTFLGTSSALTAVVYYTEGHRRPAAFHAAYVGVVALSYVTALGSGWLATGAGLLMLTLALTLSIQGREWWFGPMLVVHYVGSLVAILAPYLPWEDAGPVGIALWASGVLLVIARLAIAYRRQ